MARDFRRPELRQGFLLPPDMLDWLPQDDIVHLVLDAVSLMDLSKYEGAHRVGGVGQAHPSTQAERSVDAAAPCAGECD